MYQQPTVVISSSCLDKTPCWKFLQNEEKIRNFASVDANSYAAVVVRAIDHFTNGRVMLDELFSKPHHNTDLAAAVLKEFSNSLRASELFGIWTQDVRANLKNIADFTLQNQRHKISEVNRNALVCSAILMTQDNPVKAIDFLDICRKKYPNEVFFHRMYCDLFLFTNDFGSGLKASEEVVKLFPNNADILHMRADLLRATTDTGTPDYSNWSSQKKQIEIVKEAYKNYLKIAPKDHKNFAENNHVLAYLSLKYSTPSSQMSQSDLQELMLHFQNGLNAELNILPCFLPFSSEAKEVVEKVVDTKPPTFIYSEGDLCTIDMTTHGISGRPKPRTVSTDNLTVVDMRPPTDRRIDICVAHRKLLKNIFSNPNSMLLAQIDDDHNMNSVNSIVPPVSNNDSDDFEDIILYQMTMSKKSEVFTSKKIRLTVAEDSLYSGVSGFLEIVVADITGDVIKLQLHVSTDTHVPDGRTLKMLMKKFRFGTVWRLTNPDFHMENGEENTMFIRADPKCLIPVEDSRKCRACFKVIHPGQHCSKCKRAAYCGKECQMQDWKHLKHNLICSEAFNNFYN